MKPSHVGSTWATRRIAGNAAISNGAVHPEFEGSEVLSFIDGAVVTHITGIGLAGE